MLVKVGTANQIKITAVRIALADYFDLTDEKIIGVDVSSYVSNQPRSMAETVCGAVNRALGSFRDGADLGIGIESGLMDSPLGWMNFSAAVICEKDTGIIDNSYISPENLNKLWQRAQEHGFHFGHSSGFALPSQVTERIMDQEMELDEAVYDAALVDIPNIGKVPGGFLGVLTKDRVSRTQYSITALQMALISYENKKMFLSQ